MTFAETGGNVLFSMTAATYAGSLANYIASLGTTKQIIAKTATVLRLMALTFHTVFLASRYFITGTLEVQARENMGVHLTGMDWFWIFVGHPPYTNLFESLMFVTWVIMVAYAIIEWKWKLHPMGVIAVSLALAGLAEAYIVIEKAPGVLVPALQSKWILIHVGLVFTAYSLFLLAAIVGVFYLLKSGAKSSILGAVQLAICAIVTLLAGGVRALLTRGAFQVTPVALHETKSQITGAPRMEWAAVHYFPEGAEKASRYWVDVPWVGPLVLASVVVLLAAAGFWLYEFVSKQEKETRGAAFWVTVLGFGILTAALGLLVYQMATSAPLTAETLPSLKFAIKPPFRLSVGSNYSLGLLATTWGGVGLFLALIALRKNISARLPEPKRLDDMIYKVVIFGFPLISIGIVLGGMWAAAAWGRFWGWDPKETWALITWAVYAIYLHVRITYGPGKIPAALAVFGFGVVIFTYMGVNLGLTGDGLHVYGQG